MARVFRSPALYPGKLYTGDFEDEAGHEWICACELEEWIWLPEEGEALFICASNEPTRDAWKCGERLKAIIESQDGIYQKFERFLRRAGLFSDKPVWLWFEIESAKGEAV